MRAPADEPSRAGIIRRGDVNASQTTTDLAEVTLAADRFQLDRVVAAAIDHTTGSILTLRSGDGGRTWGRTAIPRSAGASIHADPIVAFDSRGRVHLVHLPVNNRPMGVEVNRSSDGGRTWTPSLRISSQLDDDKPILAVDDHPESPFRDHVYVAWKLPPGGVFFSRSVDRGASYSPRRTISSAIITGLDMTVDEDGAIFLAANSQPFRGIVLFRSFDGGVTFDPLRLVGTVRAGWYATTPSICNRMALVHASIDVDRSDGPGRGNLYVTWNDFPPGVTGCSNPCGAASACTSDVYLSRSSDRGETWSAPVRVHEGNLGNSDQYHHWLGVDARDGWIYVAYKDTRDDPLRLATHVYLSHSQDGGLSFEPSLRLSSAAGRATSNFQYGDYQGLWAGDGAVYAAWADFRASSQAGQIYVARTDFEGAPPPPAEGTLRFESASLRGAEPGSEVTVTAVLSGSGVPVEARYTTADASATAGTDYASTSGTLTWDEGENGPRSFTVQVFDDAEPEGLETLRVIFEDVEGAQLGSPSVAEIEILDDDGLPCSAAEPDALCLLGQRFRVEVEWRDFEGQTGSGQVVPIVSEATRSGNSGLFWFFAASNWEMLVKVLDGCGFNRHFWVFAAATTNVEYTLRVTDTLTGLGKSYVNPLGRSSDAITDVEAFDTCR